MEGFEDVVDHVRDDQEEANLKMSEMRDSYLQKATEKTLAFYFDRIAGAIQRELGDKPPHSSQKISQNSNFQEIYQTEDSLQLQKSSQNFCDKLEILGLNVIKLKKWQSQAQKEIKTLQEQCATFIKLETFRQELTENEKRCRDYTTQRADELTENLLKQQQTLGETIKKFENDLSKNEQQTLWKIRDCEDLLKTRISEHKVNDMIDAIDKKYTIITRNNDFKNTE